MSGIAFLVMASRAPRILKKSLWYMQGEDVRFFVHVDAKLDLDSFRNAVGGWPHVHYVSERAHVYWAGFSMIRATISLAKAALLDPTLDTFVLMSDDAVFARPISSLIKDLSVDRARICCRRISAESARYSRYAGYYYFDSNHSNPRSPQIEGRSITRDDLSVMAEIRALMDQGKAPVELHVGSQWWSLKRRHLQAIVDSYDADDHLRQSFRFSAVPDESYFQTLMKRFFPEESLIREPAYADFTRSPKPFVYSSPSDISALGSDGWLFVRKVSADADSMVECLYNDFLSADGRNCLNCGVANVADSAPSSKNLALFKPAMQSSTSRWSSSVDPSIDAKLGNNGDVDSGTTFHTAFEDGAWWCVDLQERFLLSRVIIFNRKDCFDRLNRFSISVSLDAHNWIAVYSKSDDSPVGSDRIFVDLNGAVGRYLRVSLIGQNYLHFRECQVYGDPLDC